MIARNINRMRENMADHQRPANRQWSLKSLKFFEVCARHQTFVAAASELYVTHSAVSKQIKSLEEGLGFKLFIRDAQVLRLSAKGRVLADHLVTLFADLSTVIDDLSDDDMSGALIISCEPTISLKLLIPLMAQIQQATGVNIQVLSAGGAINFRRDPVDLAIRRNDFAIDDDVNLYTLGKEYVGPVISVHHQRAQFKPAKMEQQTGLSFNKIHAKTRPNAWLNWQAKSAAITANDDVYFEHHFSALEAVQAGQGAAIMSIHMIARQLHQGQLLAPFGFLPDGSDYVCLSLKPIEQDQRKLLVCEWLRDEFAKNIEQAQQINLNVS
jgi:DNA-binding transcriptional LysR family regulator